MTARAKGALFALAVTVTLASPLACKRPAPPPLDLGAETTGPLVFPPPPVGWKDRTPLPPGSLEVDPEHVRMTTPQLDANRHFTIEGSTLRLVFDEPVVKDVARAPALTVSPAVKGKTVWSYESEVTFHADGPFDPDVAYTVSLPAMTAPSGRTLEALKATFHATPSIEIANKTIHYLPKKGEARPVATLPNDGGKIGAARKLTVLYDQPMDLPGAKELVTLEDGDGKPLEATIEHLQGGTLEGQKIDPRMVLVVRPKKAMAPDDTVVVRARAQVGNEEKSSKVSVAHPAAVESLGCGYTQNECEQGDKRLLGDVGTSIRVRYNNPVSSLEAKRHVTVSPAPKNVWMESWDESLRISGSFSPSTRYDVRVSGGTDDYGNALPPVAFTFETRPLPASAVVPEGALVLDTAATRAFPVTTRNVEAAELRLVALPKDDLAAFRKALQDMRAGLAPPGEPLVLPFAPRAPRDAFVDTAVDLTPRVEAGRAYAAEVAIVRTTRDAKKAAYAEGAPAGKRAHALLVVGGENALAAHVHRAGDQAVVTAFRLATGEPVAGAKITLGNQTETADAHGSALVKLEAAGPEPVCKVTHEGVSTFVALGAPSGRAVALFPSLASHDDPDEEGGPSDRVGMILTDRGVYRPGSKMHVKGYLRRLDGVAVKPLPNTKARFVVRDPRDTVLVDEVVTTDARGTFTRDVSFEPKAHTGRVRVSLFEDGEVRRLVTSQTVRVAAFEAPRFKVDVESAKTEESGNVRARVVGRYLFGAPMSGARLTWTLKKEKAPVDGGALAALGLSFDDQTYWGEDSQDYEKPITGEAELDAQGTFVVDADPGPLSPSAPTDVVVEADLTDASHRHVTGSFRTRRDPAGRHVGLRLARHFGGKGPLRVELGVVDTKGKTVVGAPVRATLERVSWSRVAEIAESKAVVERWKSVATTEASCEVTSAAKPVTCDLDVPRNGSYRIVTSVGSVPGGRASYWAYGDGDAPAPVPSEGRKLTIVADKGAYSPGDTARIFVPSPYAKATAVLTVEQGGILSHATKSIEGASGTFDVPVGIVNAPHTHVVVTLLPLGAGEVDWRIGALRLPVATEQTKLQVSVASAKKVYGVRDEAEVTIDVKRDGAPAADVDVALAVVDEGVLRLTGFHAPDPAKALHPGRGLGFEYTDTRQWLLQRRERAHVAGGGDGGGGEQSVNTRRNFVETAAFLPNLTTDAQGRARATFRLPDNLTELRMMAVAVDAVGRGGAAESSFTVTKPVLVDPVMPRFALRGDTFEAAAIVHNTTPAELEATVAIDGQTRKVTIPAGGRTRVGVPMKPEVVGKRPVAFAVSANGVEHDRAEIPLRVEAPGVEEHPRLSGVFRSEREVTLAIPADAIFEKDEALVVRTGSSLYPELGQRLGYLLGYPHGCGEQTVSSTLPLVAARTLIPWTGATPLPDDELERRIGAGLERLATMQVDGGGLAYWPGRQEPDAFVTAYAMRVVVRAKAMGLERGKLQDGMIQFLTEALDQRTGADRIAIAEALSLVGKLPADSADALWDLRENATPFSLASLALALGSLPGQGDRVKQLLDTLETSFDAEGAPKAPRDEASYWAWGSQDRDRAQAVIALARHRKGSLLLPLLATRLARGLDGYTTQSTAWSLIALADYLDGRAQESSVDVSLRLEGHVLDTTRKLGGGGREIRVPLADLRGKHVRLVFRGDDKIASAFAMEASYRRPLGATDGLLGRHGPKGPSIHRVYTDDKGRLVDLAKVKVGQTVRVALSIEMPKLESYRLSFLAVTDALPAGFEPAEGLEDAPSDIPRKHPFYDELARYGMTPDHVDVRDDVVQMYFDHMYAGEKAYATYLARATTPGTFAVLPTHAELMYEPGSEGYGDAAEVVVLP